MKRLAALSFALRLLWLWSLVSDFFQLTFGDGMVRDSQRFVGWPGFLGLRRRRGFLRVQEDHSRHAWKCKTFAAGSKIEASIFRSLLGFVILRLLVERGSIFIVRGFDLDLSISLPVPRIPQGEPLSPSEAITWISMIAGGKRCRTIDRGVCLAFWRFPIIYQPRAYPSKVREHRGSVATIIVTV